MKYTSVSVTLRKNKKGKHFQARLKYRDVATGEWRETTKILPDAKGKREALRMAKEWQDEMNAAAEVNPSLKLDKTIKEVVEEFLDYQYSIGSIEASTYLTQKGNAKNLIYKYIGNYGFLNFDRVAAQKWLTDLNAKGYKQNTICNGFIVLNKVFNYYVRIEEIDKNPLVAVKSPKHTSKITHLTNEQMDDFLTALYLEYEPQDYMYAVLHLAFYGGLRIGECMALRWNDVNFKTHMITVQSAIGKAKGGYYTKQPKTTNSIRTFPMIPQLEAALKQRYEAIAPEGNWYVCGNETSFITSLHAQDKMRQFREAYKLVDVYGEPLTLHGLRHNLGAVGIRSNMDIASLSRMFGHSKISTTLDIYGDANKEAMKVAAERLKDRFDDETEWYKTDEMQ